MCRVHLVVHTHVYRSNKYMVENYGDITGNTLTNIHRLAPMLCHNDSSSNFASGNSQTSASLQTLLLYYY